jgi:8-oxo-dGTP diphosphatase
VVSTALREAAEEAGLDRAGIRSRRLFVDDHGGWSYTTVHADVPRPLGTVANDESTELRWVAVDEVDALPLHPGFALTWPQVRARPAVLLVDAANVVGSRPDGWWRDRPGAASRLLEALVAVRAASVLGPGRAPRVIATAEVVLEGDAVSAADPGWLVVHRAGRGSSGDDVLVEVADRLVAEGNEVIAVSADRGLRERWGRLAGPRLAGSVHSVGPRWLLDVLDGTTLPGPSGPSGSMRP